MRISEALWEAYPEHKTDLEAKLFYDHFDEPAGSRVLEVGGNDCPLALCLAHAGFPTTSVDLRPYPEFGGICKHPAHKHIVSDFCLTAGALRRELTGSFDVAISVSAIEHFGLGTYGESAVPMMDVIAMRYMYDALEPGGVCYLVVPVAGRYAVHGIHWRVYDWPSILDRLVQNFCVTQVVTRVSEAVVINGQQLTPGQPAPWEVILCNQTVFPGLSILLKMIKPG